MLTSIDRDSTKDGYDILLTNEIVHAVGIPIIASGGCGKPEHMIDVFKNTEVNAALAASITFMAPNMFVFMHTSTNILEDFDIDQQNSDGSSDNKDDDKPNDDQKFSDGGTF